jgi:hypothetical protein
MEITEIKSESMEFRNHDAVETMVACRLHQLFESGQLVHGARITDVDIFGVHGPAAAPDKPPHQPKLESASRVSGGNARV